MNSYVYTPCAWGRADAELVRGRNGPCFILQPKLSFWSGVKMQFDNGRCLSAWIHRYLSFWREKQSFFHNVRSPPRSTLFWGQNTALALQQARVRWLSLQACQFCSKRCLAPSWSLSLMVLDCLSLNLAAGTASSSEAEAAVQCRQHMAMGMAPRWPGREQEGACRAQWLILAMSSLFLSVPWIIPLLPVSGIDHMCAGDGVEVVWQVLQWQSILRVSAQALLKEPAPAALPPVTRGADSVGWQRHRDSDSVQRVHAEQLGVQGNETADLENKPKFKNIKFLRRRQFPRGLRGEGGRL